MTVDPHSRANVLLVPSVIEFRVMSLSTHQWHKTTGENELETRYFDSTQETNGEDGDKEKTHHRRYVVLCVVWRRQRSQIIAIWSLQVSVFFVDNCTRSCVIISLRVYTDNYSLAHVAVFLGKKGITLPSGWPHYLERLKESSLYNQCVLYHLLYIVGELNNDHELHVR